MPDKLLQPVDFQSLLNFRCKKKPSVVDLPQDYDSLTKKIALLGSTGSIGTQALEVVGKNPDRFQVEVLTANHQGDRLIEQALVYRPNSVVIGDEAQYQKVKDALWPAEIKVYAGKKALAQIVESTEIDLVLNALVGYSGLEPTLRAIEFGKTIALANKESLVVAGELVNAKLAERRVQMIPVDSEHSAIFQCLAGELDNPIECIYLTASGGPFRGKTKPELEQVTVRQALKHPNWNMGAKITIDSATLMNKGFEVIEAKWLFGLTPEQIRVIVHPQSIIHSIVQMGDGSMKAQMGLPDMKLPIQYALTYPERIQSDFPRFSFLDYPNLTFEPPDLENFPCLQMAFDAMDLGGTAACRLNAANEIAVQSFLEEKIRFVDIPSLLDHCLQKGSHTRKPGYEDFVNADSETRQQATEWVQKHKLISI